jgi:phosphoglycolate phosphatase-like HAD superfamily hydrolase
MSAAPWAVVLDLDGVIVRSNAVKRHAMLEMFRDHPAEAAAIASYVAANPGIRRDRKIRHILERILNVHASDELVASYLARYERELVEGLAAAPLVPGVDAFLAHAEHPFYVSSTAPEREIAAQLQRRGLSKRFVAIFGATTPKVDALRSVCARHPSAAVVFFGDSVSDWEAARDAGVAFVGVVSEGDSLGGLPVPKLTDFTSPATIHECMRSACMALSS